MALSRDRRQPASTRLRNSTDLEIELLDNGSVFAIRHGAVLVNQVLGSPVEGGLGNLYVRRRGREGITFFPVIGPSAPGGFRATDDGAAWEGSVDGLDYSCTLRLAPREPTWFWTVRLGNATARRLSVDAVCAQDLGIADEAAVRSNELYTSQYIDHTIVRDDEFGFLVCSRQNLAQGDAFPWIMHGCLDGAVGFLTDGFQLYGLDYRATNVPVALARPRLPNRNYQYESALPTIQSRRLSLAPGATGEITFFAAFDADHAAASSAADAGRAPAARKAFQGLRAAAIDGPSRSRSAGLFDSPTLFASSDLGPADLDRLFGVERRHAEERGGMLLSFFHGAQQHVVLRAKELLAERPTGHIMRSGRDLLVNDDSLSLTAWMSGVFSSHVAIGNTSFNKILGVCRNPLNVLKASGQRLFVKIDGGWELLGLPSAFEMDLTSARWIYHDDRCTLTVRVATSLDAPACRLDIEIERGGPLELLVTHNVVVGANEYDSAASVEFDVANARAELRPAPEERLSQHYPEATFFILSPDAGAVEAIGGAGLLDPDGAGLLDADGAGLLDAAGADGGAPYVVVKTKPVTRFSIVITGSILDARRAAELADAYGRPPVRPTTDPNADPERAAAAFWSGLSRGATLGGATGRCGQDLARLNDLLRWYVHDGVIHLTTAHGLEQYSGAAWGVRDVCQGPVELLVATGHPAPVRSLVRIVYEHQYRQSGDWPQWFMPDRFRDVQASASHADIIVWPLKALCDYVEATGDLSILDEKLPYTDDRTMALTTEAESVFAHSERQIATLERNCIPGTALPIFAGGDWEDTLQPADPAMARRMVSSWTVELAYQTLVRYQSVCVRAGQVVMAEHLASLCARIRSDFNRHLVPGGVVAGLAHFGPDGVRYFLHPRDRRTGVAYRLLPMTRGMISGLFSAEQASRHAALIERHLAFPDGVRLMNRPMEYRGGISRDFKRAESAANFGREVGLQYVHAHIRYVEAMARTGRADEAFAGLMAVCPIRLDLDVPAALPRQANAYFSSSDAAFTDRRQASRRFGRVRTGRVGVKGGWRVYSSGPGIFINQVISNVLGLRTCFDDVVLDPVLPKRADGLTFDFEYEGRQVRYLYHVAGAGFSPREVRVNGRRLPGGGYTENPYRPGGMVIPRRAFEEALDRDENLVEIFI